MLQKYFICTFRGNGSCRVRAVLTAGTKILLSLCKINESLKI